MYTTVKHKVNCLGVWRKAFHDFDSAGKAGGESSAVGLQIDADPNEA